MMFDDMFIYGVIGGSIIVLIILLYLLYNFIKTINNSFVDDEYDSNAFQRHNEITESFINNKFKD